MKRLGLLLALLCLTAPARADSFNSTTGVRVIDNSVSNGDLRLNLSIGGVHTDVFALTGSNGRVTVGPAGSSQTNAVNGGLAVTGLETVGGTLGVTGGATIGGTLGVTGLSTLTGGATIGGTGSNVFHGCAWVSKTLFSVTTGTFTCGTDTGSTGLPYAAAGACHPSVATIVVTGYPNGNPATTWTCDTGSTAAVLTVFAMCCAL
jgi:hypothetical protein